MSGVLARALRVLKDDDLPIKFDSRGVIREMYCKGCGVKIAGMILSDEEPKQVLMDKKMINVVPMEFTHLSNYAEFMIEFSDHSAHVTSGCKGCVGEMRKLNGPEEKLQEWYEKDVAVWMREIDLTGSGKLSIKSMNRIPVRVI